MVSIPKIVGSQVKINSAENGRIENRSPKESPAEQCKRKSDENRYGFEVIDAVTKGEITLSMSPLLGCDYLFIEHAGVHEILSQRRIGNTLQELFELLGMQPHQSAAIAVATNKDKHVFTRYDFTRENNRINRISAIKIIQAEQIEFLQMMFDCSSIIESDALKHISV